MGMSGPYLAVSLARMAAFRSFLILARSCDGEASLEVELHRRPALQMHREQRGLRERKNRLDLRVDAMVVTAIDART